MANRERQGAILRTVLGILSEKPDGFRVKDVIAEAERRLPPVDDEQGEYETGARRFDKTLRFTTVPSVRAGWLVKDKGIWTVTDDGRAAVIQYPDDRALMLESLRQYRVWKKSRIPDSDSDDDADTSPAAVAASNLEEATDEAWDGIRSFIRAMNGYEFQDLVAALLEGMGYHVAWNAPRGPDQGLDILAFRDVIGADGPRIKVQVKQRPESKTSPDGINSFAAILGAEDTGVFVSTGGFTPEAERLVRNQESRRIALIGLDRLIELWIAHLDRIRPGRRELLPLRAVWFLDLPD